MNAMMSFRPLPDKKGGYVYDVIIFGPDAEKIANTRGYVDAGPPPNWIGRGGQINLSPRWKKRFPNRDKASEEVACLNSIGVEADDDTKRHFEL